MDDEDYSWVRRSRFSHSVVRSNSGREQFGAFIEQFNRGAALKQRGRGSDSGFKLHGMNFQPTTTTRTSANPPIARTRSLDAKPKKDPSSSDSKPMLGHPSQEAPTSKQDGSAGNGVFKGGNLFVDVSCGPEVLQVPKDDSPGPLDFSFHPDEQSMRLQRVCSSPSPFPAKEIPAFDAPPLLPTRSSSLKVIGEERTPMLRARSPLPSRPIPQLFKEAKSESKRFSTPPPRRKSLSPTRGAPPAAAPVNAPGKVKHKKEHWDNAMARAAALKVLDRWTVDRSKLLIGPRFASGAHSRLFNGIYMEVPVAVKFIRQPDDEEDAELALQLEKQFNTEIATLSRLQHRNVIKLVGACSSPPVFCITTEFLSGGSLRAFLHKQEHRSLPLEKIISVGLDIANDKRPEFWQIVQLLEKFKMVLDRDGTLDNMPSSNCLETPDHKKGLAHWVHKIKHHHHDLSGPPPPKLL
ncbi:hypothetical protein ACQ4PT_008385 [Festuca glaucescens]